MSDHQLFCPACGKAVSTDQAAFCPYCGAALKPSPVQKTEPDEVKEALLKYPDILDPIKRGQFLDKLLEKYPDSLAVWEEKLFLGRLAHRDKRRVDFSLIKFHLMNLYLTPETFSEAKRQEMRTQIFSHPDLDRCLALAPDAEAYMTHYLERLCTEYVHLFLRGSTQYNRNFLGLHFDSHTDRNLAAPAALIMNNIRRDTDLTEEKRSRLYTAFFRGFRNDVGNTSYLCAKLNEFGLPVPTVQ